MMRLLQHISVCVWMAFWTGLPIIFATLPRFQYKLPNVSEEILAISIFTILCIFISLVLTLLGDILIRYRLQKAVAWEQAGIPHRAARQYEKALALYDSFLGFPCFDKALQNTLLHSLAVFSLSGRITTRFSSIDIPCLYLQNHPDDTDLARVWLEGFSTKSQNPCADPLTLKVLGLLSTIYRDHKILSPVILKIFLDLGRTDYPAMELYRHILKKPDLTQHQKEEIYQLVGNGNQQIAKEFPEQNWGNLPVNEEIQGESSASDAKIHGHLFEIQKKHRAQKKFRTAAAILGIIILTGLCTRIYLAPTRPLSFFSSTAGSKISVDYAIQLGAFLDKALGEQLAEKLRKNQNRPVKLSLVKGGQKTWYVVRIEGFEDKNSAREYGKTLEAENIIQSFFVCTSEP